MTDAGMASDSKDRSPVGETPDRRPAPGGPSEEVVPRRGRDLVLFGVVFAIFLEVLRRTPSFTGVARIAPTFLGYIGVTFAIIGLVSTAVALVKQRRETRSSVAQAEPTTLAEHLARDDVRALIATFLWLVLFVAGVWTLGFIVGGALFCAAYLRLSAGFGPVKIFLTVVPVLVLLTQVIPRYLIVPIYHGLLAGWLG